MTTVFLLREVLESMPKAPGLSELARLADVSRTTVHLMYHNHSSRVDLATLDALARVLGCEPGDLVGTKRGKVR